MVEGEVLLKEKEHFKQALQGVVNHAKDLLIKKGVLPPETKPLNTACGAQDPTDIGDLSAISSQLGFEIKPPQQQQGLQQDEETIVVEEKEVKKPSGFFSGDLSKLADLNLSGGGGTSSNVAR